MRFYKWLCTSLLIAQSAALSGVEPFYPAPKTFPAYTGSLCLPQEKVALPSGKTVGDFMQSRSLSGTWKILPPINSSNEFSPDMDLNLGYQNDSFNDSAWADIAVPLDFYTKFPAARQDAQPYVKTWYRHHFNLAASDSQNRRLLLKFGVIGYEGKLFINGRDAGTHRGDFTPWTVDVSSLVKPGVNTIALRVFSDFGPGFGVKMPAKHTYGSQWAIHNIRGGLWQEVELLSVPEVYAQRLLANPRLAQNAVEFEYQIINPTSAPVKIPLQIMVSSAMKTDANALNAVSDPVMITLQPGINQGSLTVKLNQPRQWSPDSPYLYYATLFNRDSGQPLGIARFGFREFKAVGTNFYLNGERIYLFGENDPSIKYDGYGRSDAEERQLHAKEIIGYKALGYNIIRNAHMPQSPHFYDLADELGMMVYDEWSWGFTQPIDPVEFPANNQRELLEWFYRDYNHPSVVMFSCGNEVCFNNSKDVKNELDAQVKILHRVEKSGRPIGSFSGSGGLATYGDAKLETDFLDLHEYLGLYNASWSDWNKRFSNEFSQAAAVYNDAAGKFPVPFIVWECVGFSWGHYSVPNFKENNIDEYIKYTKQPTNWGAPNGVGLTGAMTLADALNPQRGMEYGQKLIGRRIIEQIRFDSRIQGFAPWFQNAAQVAATLWNQAVYHSLLDETGIMARNFFSGVDNRYQLAIVNSSSRTAKKPSLEIIWVDAAGKQKTVFQQMLPPLSAWEQARIPITFKLPEVVAGERGQLRTLIKDGNNEISRNFFDIYLQRKEILNSAVKQQRTIAVYQDGQFAAIEKIMTALQLKFTPLKTTTVPDGVQVVIVPPGAAPTIDPLLSWVNRGGILCVMEQEQSVYTLPDGLFYFPAENTLIDPFMFDHPLFAGMDRECFDIWNHIDRGMVIKNAVTPFGRNALAVRGAFLGSSGISMAIMEAVHGKGRFIASQLQATGLWGRDSAASTYLRNLLAYLANGELYAKATLLQANTYPAFKAIDRSRVESINLRPYVNRNFKEWTGQGSNDFRHMPLGLQNVAGIPFEIIDPATNHDKAALILKGNARPEFPAAINNIAVGKKFKRLFFLHTSAWGDSAEDAVYRIRYEDKTTVDYPMFGQRNVSDWWGAADLPEARAGLALPNAQGYMVGMVVAGWVNPHPEKKIAAIDFISSGNAVPILVALSGEKTAL